MNLIQFEGNTVAYMAPEDLEAMQQELEHLRIRENNLMMELEAEKCAHRKDNEFLIAEVSDILKKIEKSCP